MVDSPYRKGLLRSKLASLDAENATDWGGVFNEALTAAFDSGFQMAARLEQRNAQSALAMHALRVLGKDPGDGIIDLGALGRWAVLTDDATAIMLERSEAR